MSAQGLRRILLAMVVAPALGACVSSSARDPVHVLGPAPERLELRLDARQRACLAEALDANSDLVVRLSLGPFFARNAGGLKGVKLFLQAGERLDPQEFSDEHALGSLVLGFAQGESHLWNMGPLLAKQWRTGLRRWSADGLLSLDLVPEAWEPEALAADFELRIMQASIEIPECSP